VELTRFLRVPGAPLDNNISECALKRAILHRINALFYRTLAGAHVGDMFMSLIHTAALAANPADWMPWTDQATLARGDAGPDPPP
jgi:transposase